MIDVHAPEHGIHGMRDFFIHLFTITCGLLIALGLEAGVEAAHHRHQRDEAEATIRTELNDNRADLIETQGLLKTETDMMVRILQFLEDRAANRPGDATGLGLGYSEKTLKNAGWKTASATGVLSYIDYDRVQRFAEAYEVQEQFEGLESKTLDEYLQLNSDVVTGFDPKKITPQFAASMEPDARRAISDLVATRDMSRDLVRAYNAALK